MEIRTGEEKDIPDIVRLLKISLGESLMPKSEEFWRWKHVDNPFGPSPVLVAIEGDHIIAVRAFIRWNWIYGNKIYKSVRAVDTATHPAYQRKGIFRKLTLQLVDQCEADGINFIFNTPNPRSKPGYIKMGWHDLGNLKVQFLPVLNFKKMSSEFSEEYKFNNQLISQLYSSLLRITNFATFRSSDFFRWRYDSNPNATYHMIASPKFDFAIIFRIKSFRFGKEFRIVEIIRGAKYSEEEAKRNLLCAIKASGANLVTASGTEIPRLNFGLNIGPSVTIKPLNFSIPMTLDFWKPSLGDMELF